MYSRDHSVGGDGLESKRVVYTIRCLVDVAFAIIVIILSPL
jgi:hypothetical protein